MKRSTKVLIVGSALLVGAAGIATAGYGWKKGRHMHAAKAYLESVDTDKDQAISKSELEVELTSRFTFADKDASGEVTKAEIIQAVEELESMPFLSRRSGSIADRFTYRFDLDDNGSVSKAEIDNRIGKFFAVLDRNDDGKVEMAEVKRMRGFGRHGHHRGKHGGWRGWGAEERTQSE